MADRDLPHDLEHFPRQELTMGLTRRQFFSTLLIESRLRLNRAQGANAISLSSLGKMPDEALEEMIPGIPLDCKIFVKDQGVWAQPSDRRGATRLFPIHPINSFIFNQMNGKNTLHQIADQLCERFTLSEERAFAITRGVFLVMVQAGACFPQNNPGNG
jgi:hypothetical protein